MALLLSGEKIAEQLIKKLEKEKSSKKLNLAVVQVAENAISALYIREKKKAARRLGIDFRLVSFPERISQEKLKHGIVHIAKETSGVIVQLPLPRKFAAQEVLDAIPIEKDVDVLSSAAFGLFALGRLSIMPPTVKATSLIFQHYDIELKGRRVVLIGAGRLVGLPLIPWLLREKATVMVANEFTKNLSLLTRQADILISGVGKNKLIKASMVKQGTVVIDAGTSVEKGKTSGDVDFNAVIHKAKAITPVPGGVGPLTVACLLENLFILSQRHKNGT